MSVSRRDFVKAAGTASALAFMAPGQAGAKPFEPDPSGFQPKLLPSIGEVWESVVHVNEKLGPTRLTGSADHTNFVNYLAALKSA